MRISKKIRVTFKTTSVFFHTEYTGDLKYLRDTIDFGLSFSANVLYHNTAKKISDTVFTETVPHYVNIKYLLEHYNTSTATLNEYISLKEFTEILNEFGKFKIINMILIVKAEITNENGTNKRKRTQKR